MTFPLIENIVRPFQQNNYLPARQNLVPGAAGDVLHISLGGAGGRTTSFTQDGSGEVIATREVPNKFHETSRISTTVRVENPDDADQFVDFKRADQVELKAEPVKIPDHPTKKSTYVVGQVDAQNLRQLIDERQAEERAAETRTYNFKYPDGPDRQSGGG
jgi:hypothetical protein